MKNATLKYFNEDTQQYEVLQLPPQPSPLGEAPTDGKTYGRNGKTQTWELVQTEIDSIPDDVINALFP